MNIDFEKWNINMRKELTVPPFLKSLINYFVTLIYSIVHTNILEIAGSMYLADEETELQTFTEDLQENSHCWKSNLGTLEGQRQKG